MSVCLKSFIYHVLKSVLPNIMQCVLPNTILKCPSEHAAMCPSKHELCVQPNMKLESRNKGSPLQLALKPSHTLMGNIIWPKAPNMQVWKKIAIWCEKTFGVWTPFGKRGDEKHICHDKQKSFWQCCQIEC